ncbi:MAG: hypothetical protein ACKVTZ_00420 [Bacteroidia bacterium]
MNLNADYIFYYLVICGILTVLICAYLYWQGGKFLMQAFQKEQTFARSLNNMLLVLFLLGNAGYLLLTSNPSLDEAAKEGLYNSQHLTEKLIYRIGLFIFILSIEFGGSLVALFFIRKSRMGAENADNDPDEIVREPLFGFEDE